MVDNPPTSFPRVTPYLLYEDVPAALAWLSEAFGFEERERWVDENGTLSHGELALGGVPYAQEIIFVISGEGEQMVETPEGVPVMMP